MTTLLSFDQATVTGWTYAGNKIDMKEWKSGHFRALKRPLEGERLVLIEDSAIALIREFDPDIVVYETPFDPTYSDAKKGVERQQFSRSTMQFLQRVVAAIEMAAARCSVPVEHYMPRQWRSALHLPDKPMELMRSVLTQDQADIRAKVADGTLKKPGDWVKKQTREAVRRLGAQVETLDEADSWGLAFYALHGAAGAKRAQDNLFDRVKASAG